MLVTQRSEEFGNTFGYSVKKMKPYSNENPQKLEVNWELASLCNILIKCNIRSLIHHLRLRNA